MCRPLPLRMLDYLRLRSQVRPSINISRFGQLTDNPQVTLSAHSRRGTIGIGSAEDTEQGNAKIEMWARSLSRTLLVPIVDERPLQMERETQAPRLWVDMNGYDWRKG